MDTPFQVDTAPPGAACQAVGRDPQTLRRSHFRAGYPGAEDPWTSVDAFTDFVGRCREIAVSTFVFRYPPVYRERPATFERIVTEAMPALRANS